MPRPAALPRIGLTLAAALAGCTLGTPYRGPVAAAPPAARFARGGDLSAAPPTVARWWEALGDPTLDALEARALAASPDLARARARVVQARAALRERKAAGLPSVNATALYAHARLPGLDLGSLSGGDGATGGGAARGASGTSALDIYDIGFDASWEVDLFGGQRRGLKAARATADAARADLADVQLSLTAEVAQAYVNARDRQRRVALAARSVATQARMVELTAQRFAGGTASRLDVTRLRQQLDAARADTVPLDAEREAYLDELAMLTDDGVAVIDQAMAADRPVPLPPAAFAIGDPAALIRRRPDIRAAERRLAADAAKVGEAQASRFPKLRFMGLLGIGGSAPGDLTRLDDFSAILAPQLSWGFLDFGRSLARVRQARGVRDESEARYRTTVLAALRDAEDALSRFRHGREAVALRARAKAAADDAGAMSRQRYAAGTTTLIDVLDTQRRQDAAEQDLAAAESGLTRDFVAIQKALGSGWGAAP